MPRKSDPTHALDFFRGFEAAARHLSFTRAAEELFLTQSAISRQIQALEERLGVALFVRRNRGLALTEAGEQMYRAAGIALRALREAADRITPGAAQRMVTVTSSMAFCSLWLIPRLNGFRRMHPDIDVRISANNQLLDLDRERIDLAVRYCPPRRAPEGSIRLFGEEILPVCSPALLVDRTRPLKSIGDLKHHVLLHFDDSERSAPWLSWNVWLETAGVPELKPAGALRFNHYDQVISAAVGGQGVAIGRRPLVRNLLDDGRLATPFTLGAVTDRAYFIVRTAATAGRVEVDAFMQWLRSASVISPSAAGAEDKSKKGKPGKVEPRATLKRPSKQKK